MIFQDEYISYGFTFGTFLPGIIALVVNIVIAVFIARDAKNRGMEPTIYVILTICCGCFIGGIIYLVTASNHPIQTDEFQQPSFSSSQNVQYGQPQTTYGQLQYQQTAPPPQPKPADVDMEFCPVCGSENQRNAKFCSHCGADLK